MLSFFFSSFFPVIASFQPACIQLSFFPLTRDGSRNLKMNKMLNYKENCNPSNWCLQMLLNPIYLEKKNYLKANWDDRCQSAVCLKRVTRLCHLLTFILNRSAFLIPKESPTHDGYGNFFQGQK